MALNLSFLWPLVEQVAPAITASTLTKVDDHLWAAVKAAKEEGWFASFFSAVAVDRTAQIAVPADAEAFFAARGVSLADVIEFIRFALELLRPFLPKEE